jgi:rod shape-determining protein MreD
MRNFDSRPQRILLPAKPGFIALSVAAALGLNLMPWGDFPGVPDFVALVLVFWCIHQPRRMGMSIPFAVGLIMDAANATLMGQHAFAYAVMAFGAMTISRRVLWFSMGPQSMHVFGLLMVGQLLVLLVGMLVGASFPGLAFFIASMIGAALWPLATLILLAPQRRPEMVDENRPI